MCIRDSFKELFRALEAGETPILFHCTAGKDRTGVAAMLILLALGASDETICADYARTNLCRAAEIEKAMADHAAEIAADPGKVDAALDLLMVIKYLERIGDHAVNVAEWVQFVRTGRYKDESMF